VLGLYDHIVAGHFALEEEEQPGERPGLQMSSAGSAQFGEQRNLQLSGDLDGQGKGRTRLQTGAPPASPIRSSNGAAMHALRDDPLHGLSPGHALRFRVLAQRTGPIRELFLATPFAGRLPTAWDCYPVMVLLFLSMLPLHADAPLRQRALLANAIRVYLEWRAHDRDSDGGNEPPLL